MKRPSSRRRRVHAKRNGVGEFGVRGHVVEVALGNGPLYPGQVTIDPPTAYSDRSADRDPVTETTLAVALQSLAERMDPGWAGPRRRVVLDTNRPMSLSWQSGQGLALPMTTTAIVTALREAVNRIHPPAHQGASHLVGGLEVVQIPSDFDGKVLVSVRNATTHRVDAGATAALEALKRSSDEYRYAVDSFDPMAGVRGLLMPVTVNIAKVRRDLEHALATAPTAHAMPRASAPKAPRAARPIARKPAGRGKASAAARKPAPRKSAARKPATPRKATSKRNGMSWWTLRGHQVVIETKAKFPRVWENRSGRITVRPIGGAQPDPYLAAAMNQVAADMDPDWGTPMSRISIHNGPTMVLSWTDADLLRPKYPLTPDELFKSIKTYAALAERTVETAHEMQRLTGALRTHVTLAAPGNSRHAMTYVTEQTPVMSQASVGVARKSPKPRKHVPRKTPVMKRRGSARGRTAKRNGGADFGGYGEDIAKGAPVRLSPHTDLYMMGDKYGTARGAPGRDGTVSVKLDRSGRIVKLPAVAMQRDYR